ncbi:hypothetical protein AYI70_g3122 [Smittium culicis]|uniref:Uncharacterized protein n=1 Tax=Smittium culicis TaxID=133412 RepID=A0A1R1Y4Z1_9FUNG|nr:hypothetical protein AYI70_g3122 [Smittium culicis]
MASKTRIPLETKDSTSRSAGEYYASPSSKNLQNHTQPLFQTLLSLQTKLITYLHLENVSIYLLIIPTSYLLFFFFIIRNTNYHPSPFQLSLPHIAPTHLRSGYPSDLSHKKFINSVSDNIFTPTTNKFNQTSSKNYPLDIHVDTSGYSSLIRKYGSYDTTSPKTKSDIKHSTPYIHKSSNNKNGSNKPTLQSNNFSQKITRANTNVPLLQSQSQNVNISSSTDLRKDLPLPEHSESEPEPDLDEVEEKFIDVLNRNSLMDQRAVLKASYIENSDSGISNWDDDFTEVKPAYKGHYLGIGSKSAGKTRLASFGNKSATFKHRVASGSTSGSFINRRKKSRPPLQKKNMFNSTKNERAAKALEAEKKVLLELSIIECLQRNFKEIKELIDEIVYEFKMTKSHLYRLTNISSSSLKSAAEKEPSPEEEELWEHWREAESFVIFCGNKGFSNSQDTLNNKITFQSYCFSDKRQQDIYINKLRIAILSSINKKSYSANASLSPLAKLKNMKNHVYEGSDTYLNDSENENTFNTDSLTVGEFPISPDILLMSPNSPKLPNDLTLTVSFKNSNLNKALSKKNLNNSIKIQDIAVLNKIALGIINKTKRALENYLLTQYD